jgi:hypothetical protein
MGDGGKTRVEALIERHGGFFDSGKAAARRLLTAVAYGAAGFAFGAVLTDNPRPPAMPIGFSNLERARAIDAKLDAKLDVFATLDRRMEEDPKLADLTVSNKVIVDRVWADTLERLERVDASGASYDGQLFKVAEGIPDGSVISDAVDNLNWKRATLDKAITYLLEVKDAANRDDDIIGPSEKLHSLMVEYVGSMAEIDARAAGGDDPDVREAMAAFGKAFLGGVEGLSDRRDEPAAPDAAPRF